MQNHPRSSSTPHSLRHNIRGKKPIIPKLKSTKLKTSKYILPLVFIALALSFLVFTLNSKPKRQIENASTELFTHNNYYKSKANYPRQVTRALPKPNFDETTRIFKSPQKLAPYEFYIPIKWSINYYDESEVGECSIKITKDVSELYISNFAADVTCNPNKREFVTKITTNLGDFSIYKNINSWDPSLASFILCTDTPANGSPDPNGLVAFTKIGVITFVLPSDYKSSDLNEVVNIIKGLTLN